MAIKGKITGKNIIGAPGKVSSFYLKNAIIGGGFKPTFPTKNLQTDHRTVFPTNPYPTSPFGSNNLPK